MIKKRILSFILIGVMSLFVSERGISASIEIEKQILEKFQIEFDRVKAFAESQKRPFASDVLMDFIETQMMKRWSAELTIRAIVGKKRWRVIKPKEKQELILAYENTMKRYLYETFQQYKGQKPVAEKVELHSNHKKGWLTVRLLIPNFSDVTLDLKIYNRDGEWLIYDFRYQGVSFVQLKALDYFLTLKINGAEGLINKLNKKNEQLYKSLESKP